MYARTVKLSDVQKSGSFAAEDNIQITLTLREFKAIQDHAAICRKKIQSLEDQAAQIQKILAAVEARNQK